jgi:hypothetical protein
MSVSAGLFILVVIAVFVLMVGYVIGEEKRRNQIRPNPADESGLWGVLRPEVPSVVSKKVPHAEVPTV